MRFHIFSFPPIPSHKDYSSYAFAQKSRKLCWMLMHAGFEVYHYGNELSEVKCTEHITVTTAEELRKTYPNLETAGFQSDPNKEINIRNSYTKNTSREARLRAQPGDFFCYVTSRIQVDLYNLLQDLPVHHIESGVGYFNTFMKYVVYESPGIMAWHYGYFANNNDRYRNIHESERTNYPYDENTHFTEPPLYHAVIPNSFDVEDFDFRINKEDYLLYLGRIVRNKGVDTAIEIANRLNKKLIVAGPGDFESEYGYEPTGNVEFVGNVGVEARREYLSKALALLCISKNWEPFGGVHIEAMLSGTPPISSDVGGYVHTIRSGYNGFRVRMDAVEQGVRAVMNIDKINPYNLRDFGLRFSNQEIAQCYKSYFTELDNLINRPKGEHSGSDLTSLDWIDYDRPIEWSKELMTPVDSDPEPNTVTKPNTLPVYVDIKESFARHNTDKQTKHSYGDLYNYILNSMAVKLNRKLRILEIGTSLWDEGSLSVWDKIDYIDTVVGVDIDQYRGTLSDKSTFYQRDAYSIETVNYIDAHHPPFDIIIDDGSHWTKDQLFFMNNYERLLSDEGILICEDVIDTNFIQLQCENPNVTCFDLWANRGVNPENRHDSRMLVKQKDKEYTYMENKPHISRLPVVACEEYDRSSTELAVSIPLFHSALDTTKEAFNVERFQNVHCKGAIWAALSLIHNTDLAHRKTPIYFHIEDKVMEYAKPVFDQFQVPESWIKEVTMPDSAETLPMAMNKAHFGKKYIPLLDNTIEPDVLLIYDSDAYVLCEKDPILMYDLLTSDLIKSKPSMSYNKYADLQYWWWISVMLEASGRPAELINSNRLNKLEQQCFHRLGFEIELPPDLEKDDTVNRLWAENYMVTFPKGHPVRDYTLEHIHKCHCSPYIHVAWSYHKDMFVQLQNLLRIPVYDFETDYVEAEHNDCVAHLRLDRGESTTRIDEYWDKYLKHLTINMNSTAQVTSSDNSVPTTVSTENITDNTTNGITYHCVAIPHLPTPNKQSNNAHAQNVVNVCESLCGNGYNVIHYGHPDSQVACSEHVSVTSADLFAMIYRDEESPQYSYEDPVYTEFYTNTIRELQTRIKPNDFVICFWSFGHKQICIALENEPVHVFGPIYLN